ncbi:ankyrin repeat domain-containing protein 17-like [Pollicipes pollicipes]|uniref:ankyrin repeat domain-containing protein 17-like n=1 Tax=Pollicipes pollicipes TaxID=41117 RepID=UPI001884C07C|nr:ankyrin repeat domain-containing protein 17-like [Pollicipes pollicipes]
MSLGTRRRRGEVQLVHKIGHTLRQMRALQKEQQSVQQIVNATVPGGGGKTALMLAAWRGHTTLVMLLIARGVAIEARNTAGRTALWWALDAGHATTARLLQTCDASVDVQDTRQVSCIMAAYRRGNVELVRWLLGCVSQLPSDAELKQCLRSRSKKCLYFIRAERKQRGY